MNLTDKPNNRQLIDDYNIFTGIINYRPTIEKFNEFLKTSPHYGDLLNAQKTSNIFRDKWNIDFENLLSALVNQRGDFSNHIYIKLETESKIDPYYSVRFNFDFIKIPNILNLVFDISKILTTTVASMRIKSEAITILSTDGITYSLDLGSFKSSFMYARSVKRGSRAIPKQILNSIVQEILTFYIPILYIDKMNLLETKNNPEDIPLITKSIIDSNRILPWSMSSEDIVRSLNLGVPSIWTR